MENSHPKKVVIVGGGFAGLNCAKALANDPQFEVTLLDRENHHLFQPLLYQIATASLSVTDIARSLRALLANSRNVTLYLDEATHVDTEQKILHSPARSYPYDSLIIAAGVKTSWFGNQSWAQHTMGLKSLNDAYTIRQRVLQALEDAEKCPDPEQRKALMTVAIVGGGPTGVELAGAFADLVRVALKKNYRHIDPADLKVIVIQSGERILKAFSPEHSQYAQNKLESLGVEIRLGPRVTMVEAGRLRVGETDWIEAENIIWAAGVEAAEITGSLSSERDRAGRLVVNGDLSLPEHPHIFAVGDIAKANDRNGDMVPGLAPAAVQMGQHIAKVLGEDLRLQKTKYRDRVTEFRPQFRYKDKGIMAIIGKNAAVVQSNKLKLKGFPAWLTWLLIHILFLIGFRNKLSVLLQWAFTYLGDKPGARVYSQEATPHFDHETSSK